MLKTYTLNQLAELAKITRRQVRYQLEKQNILPTRRGHYGEDALKVLLHYDLGRQNVPEPERGVDTLQSAIANLEALPEAQPVAAAARGTKLRKYLDENKEPISYGLLDLSANETQYEVSVALRSGVTINGRITQGKLEQLFDLLES